MDWDKGHPYAWRTWLRSRLPWFLIDLGVASKGKDCEEVEGWHRWYNIDGKSSGCYHCRQVREGRLWESAV
jgi:hypothetical protein